METWQTAHVAKLMTCDVDDIGALMSLCQQEKRLLHSSGKILQCSIPYCPLSTTPPHHSWGCSRKANIFSSSHGECGTQGISCSYKNGGAYVRCLIGSHNAVAPRCASGMLLLLLILIRNWFIVWHKLTLIDIKYLLVLLQLQYLVSVNCKTCCLDWCTDKKQSEIKFTTQISSDQAWTMHGKLD